MRDDAPPLPIMSFPNRLLLVRQRIDAACTRHGQDTASIRLMAVSKTFPADDVRVACEAGMRDFGENYVQEGVDKIGLLKDLRSQITWHFIGPLQSNKTRDVAEHFDWMHTVDRAKIARRLSEQRPAHMPPLQICLQVNLSGEASKSGVAPTELAELARDVAAMPGLQLRGLMAIPEPTTDEALQRKRFRELGELLLATRTTLTRPVAEEMNCLSMGMSADLESAIAETLPGVTTMVRVGTALFGERPRPDTGV